MLRPQFPNGQWLSISGSLLFPRLFMDRLSAIPFAELFELDLALDKLLILVAPIVGSAAAAAGKLDESVL